MVMGSSITWMRDLLAIRQLGTDVKLWRQYWVMWKNFDLNMDFSGAGMQSWFQNYELRNPFHAGGNSAAYLLEDRWHRADVYDPNSEWIPGKYPA